jgi:endoglucanase
MTLFKLLNCLRVHLSRLHRWLSNEQKQIHGQRSSIWGQRGTEQPRTLRSVRRRKRLPLRVKLPSGLANLPIMTLVILAIGLYSCISPTVSRSVPTLPPPVAAVTPIQPPLSTKGADIVDTAGRVVLLRGVNWFGLETETHAPHGLWSRDYKEMLAQMKALGYNLIRLPYSVQGLSDTTVSGIDFAIGSNRELRDKTPLEVMDLVIQEAGRQGLLILLDSHRLNNQRIPELWYGDGFSEADWINAWTALANRYKNQSNVIGADLKNEPHGRASWGTNDKATDWRLAAERAGNAILKVNPNWLIVVEGVENNVPGQKLKRHWMGGNLEGVQKFPVRLSARNKVVYSPHEYGEGVFKQPWFAEASFPRNLEARWDTGFYYIARQKIAPILIGEFGGRQVDAKSKEGIWQRQLVEFIQRRKLSFAYWSWNPNSADTGGILLDDWKAVDQPKQTLLSQLLPAAPMRSTTPLRPINQPRALPRPQGMPSPKPSTSPQPQATPSPQPSASPQPQVTPNPQPSALPKPQASPSLRPSNPLPSPKASVPPPSARVGSLETKLVVQSDWAAGFCLSLPVKNMGPSAIANWRLQFQMNQAKINQSWNGTFARQASTHTVTPADWGRTIQPQQTVDIGFCATKSGPDYMPKQVVAIAQ